LLSVNEKLKNELLYLRRTLLRSSERFIVQDPNQLRRQEESGEYCSTVRQALPAHLERKEEVINQLRFLKLASASAKK
jgi:hypothetical protein